MRSVLYLFLWVTLIASALADPAPKRVAIIADGSSTDLAALVSAELSSNPAFTLLERQDLDKAGDELKVQQLAGSDPVALGKIVGADGLLFLTKDNAGPRIRFTAVGLGYALVDEQLPADATPAQESKLIVHRVSGYTEKLSLDPGKAVPVSILNLRADTAASGGAEVERNLTLLLESKLTAVPDLVVLERRHAWSLGFEHSLDPSARPLLRGAWLIDGSLVARGDDCTVTLRIRRPDGRADQSVTVPGKASDLDALAASLVTEIGKTLGHAVPSSLADTGTREADEYVAEALWAWRAKVPRAALEAIDSAELLGAPPERVLALRIQILADLANRGMERWWPPFDQKDPVFDAAALDEKVALLKRAIDDTVRYRDEKLESKLGQFVPSNGAERVSFRASACVSTIGVITSETLYLLDKAGLPADDLRLDLRRLTGYDPLNGKAGSLIGGLANNANAADAFSDNWARTIEEKLAWMRLRCLDSTQILPRYSLQEPAKNFCARFLPDIADREKKFEEFVESMKDDPNAARTYLVLKTHFQDLATAQAAFAAYIAAILPFKDEITTTDKYTPLVESIWYLGPVAHEKSTIAMPLVHAVLDAEQPGQAGVIVLKNLWRPEDTPPEEAAQIWKETKAYMQRRTDVVAKKTGRLSGYAADEVDNRMYYFKCKYPDIVKASAADAAIEAAPLTVSAFWYPWKVPGVPLETGIVINNVTGGEKDTVYLCGLMTHLENSWIFKVHLPDLTTDTIQIENYKANAQGLLWTPEALYLSLFTKDSKDGYWHQLGRYSFATSSWETRSLPVSFRPDLNACINGSLYLVTGAGGPSLGDHEVGLGRYDWDTGKFTLLANNRRRPAQNQFDDVAPFMVSGFFAGPGGKPAVTMESGTYYIQETPGDWQPVFDGRFSDTVLREEGRTLVYNMQGEVTCFDPKAAAPIPLMAADTPLYRRPKGLPGTPGPVPTPWAADAIWDCPPGKQKRLGNWYVAFHDNRLYVLDKPDPMKDRYDLLCYDRAFGRKPARIPLQFQLTEPDTEHPRTIDRLRLKVVTIEGLKDLLKVF